jgi:hypothetical protein
MSFSTLAVRVVSMSFARGHRDQITESEVRLLIVFVSMVIQCDYGDVDGEGEGEFENSYEKKYLNRMAFPFASPC